MKMWELLLSCLLLSQAGAKPVDENKEVNDCNYTAELLKEKLDRPYLLSTDYNTNTIYFSYTVPSKTDEGVENFTSAYIHLNTKDYGTINNVQDGFAQSVDQKTGDVYIGGSDGIYKYDHNTKNAELLGAKDTDIWMIYFKEVLYYSVFPSQFLYTLVDGTSTRFSDLEDTKVDHMVIDNENDIFFTNETGLFSQKKGTKNAVFFANNISVRALTTDMNGKPYICLNNGVYSINKKEIKLDLVFETVDAFGLTFDSENNFVCSDDTSIYRIKADKHKCNDGPFLLQSVNLGTN
ncbi:ommochrome-binding protein [Plutella xylostella]|uniref:ommochrome-binding protein n=1 Tax=Plutella xylostella TaxID=51655 RepID=UPI002032811F|nr:ommochrome-binding protein [Plutella xylostella]